MLFKGEETFMRKLFVVAVVGAALVVPTAAQAETSAGPYDLGCFYADSAPDWNRQAFYSMACIQNWGYWVNGPQPLRLTGVASDADGTHTLLTRMNYGQQFPIVADWDPRVTSGSTCCTQPGVKVTIRR